MTVTDLPEGVEPTPLALLLLGPGGRPRQRAGRGLPWQPPGRLRPGAGRPRAAAKAALGESVFVLGHHYQRDEVIQFADVTGDSFKLAQQAAARPEADLHRLLRRALHGRERRHPHRRQPAGDPARPRRRLLDGRHGDRRAGGGGLGRAARRRCRRGDRPGHLHELLGRDQGLHGPPRRHDLHLVQRGTGAAAGPSTAGPSARCSSCPTSTSGRNTAVRELGLSLDDCVVYDPHKPGGGADRRAAAGREDDPVARATARCTAGSPSTACARSASASRASRCSSTRSAGTRWSRRRTWSARPSTSSRPSTRRPAGSAWAVGTELNLVQRLAKRHPDKIDRLPRPDRLLLLDHEPHRPAAPGVVLESLAGGSVVNRISVDPETARYARKALDQMLALPQYAP